MTGSDAPDPAVARRNAKALAEALGSRAVAKRHGVLGEPLCLYNVPLHGDGFWFNVGVSDTACVIEARLQKQPAPEATFAVALGEPWYGSTEPSAELSEATEADVFVPPAPEWREAARLLLLAPLRRLVEEVDWSVVHRVALYDVHLRALLAVDSLPRCACEIQLLRRLLIVSHQLAHRATSSTDPSQ